MKPSKLQRFRYVPLFVNATLMRLTRIGGPAALFLCAIALPQSSRAACPLPGPNQAVVYQHAHRGGNCAVLEIGNYFKPPFGSVQNDSISSIDIGSNVRSCIGHRCVFLGQLVTLGRWFLLRICGRPGQRRDVIDNDQAADRRPGSSLVPV